MVSLKYQYLPALITVVLYGLASADVYTLTAYPSDSCSVTGYYTTFSTEDDSNSCSSVSYADSSFQLVNDDYQIYWQLEQTLSDGCEVALLGEPTDSSRSCGECIGRISTLGGCSLIPVPQHFYVTWCCGGDCTDYCGAPGKRDVAASNWTEPVRMERTVPKMADPAKMKSSPPFTKRADCSFASSGNTYNQAGTPVQVTNTINTCTSADGCSVSYSGSVEKSFSQTFGVSETTEAGLFDIVSESVTFSYDATWESSTTVTQTGTFNVPDGEGGYVTFSPLSQCIDGSFSGSECPDGVTVGQDGTACIPEKLSDGMLNGDLNLVISA